MSRETLIEEYAAGRMSRRTLIRRLVAGGVSLGAAAAYAHALGPQRSSAAGFSDEYGFVTVRSRIIEQDLDRVIANEALKIRLTLAKRGRVEFRVYVVRPPSDTQHARDLIGQRFKKFDHGVTKKVLSVPLAVNPPHSVDTLRLGPDPATLELETVVRRNRAPQWGSDHHQRQIFR